MVWFYYSKWDMKEKWKRIGRSMKRSAFCGRAWTGQGSQNTIKFEYLRQGTVQCSPSVADVKCVLRHQPLNGCIYRVSLMLLVETVGEKACGNMWYCKTRETLLLFLSLPIQHLHWCHSWFSSFPIGVLDDLPSLRRASWNGDRNKALILRDLNKRS